MMKDKERLIIIGAGGFTKSIIDSLDKEYFELVGFIDTFKKGMQQGYPVLTNNIEYLDNPEQYAFFIGIGDPATRYEFYQLLIKKRLKLINIIDKTALISTSATLGKGIYIGKMCIVNPDTTIKDGVVINTRSLIEHGNVIECCSNISTNVVLNGDVKVGEKTFVGSCTVVNGQLKIGRNSIIGSGSVVIRNVPDNVVVAGSPTRLIREIKDE